MSDLEILHDERNFGLADPDDFASLQGRGVIFLANHQVAVESLLFSALLSSLTGVSIQTIAKASHRDTWVGRLVELCLRRLVLPDVVGRALDRWRAWRATRDAVGTLLESPKEVCECCEPCSSW